MPRIPTTLLLTALLLVAGAPPTAAADERPFDADIAAGDEAFARGDLPAAIVAWLTAHKAVAAADPPLPDVEVDLLLKAAAAHRELGNVVMAGDLLGLAESVAAGAGGAAVGDGVLGARVDAAIGLLALTTGDARRAEKRLVAAFTRFRELSDPQGAANAAVNLGLARRGLGKYDEAAKAFAAAWTLFDALGDRDGQADALTNSGVLHRGAGRLGEARDALTRALELYRATGNLAGEADALTNLGSVLQDLGRDADAERLYRAALDTARDRRDVLRQARLLSNLGTLAHARGELAAAAEHYRAAEEAFDGADRPAEAAAVALNRAGLGGGDRAAFEGVLGRAKKLGDRRLEAIAALNLAALLRDDDPAAARRHADRARQLASQLELADVHWRALHLAGTLEIAAGKDRAGTALLREAVDGLERTRRGLDAADAQRFVVGHDDVYQALIDALLRQGDSLGAFVYAERLQLRDLPPVTPPDDDPEVQRYQQLASEQAWLGDALSAELQRGDGTDSPRAEQLREQLAAMRVEFADTVDRLRAGYPHFDELVRVDPEDLEAVQAGLPDGVVVLQPILLPDRLELLVFRRDRLVTRSVEVEAAAVEKAVARLTRSLRAADTFDPAWTDELCARLGGWLLAPIVDDLDGASVLVVSATGALRSLPFGLLRHDDAYLVERIAVASVTHVGSLRPRAGEQPRFRLAGGDLLLVGNPDGTLPGAEQEVEAIAARFPAATTLVGPAGTRAALQREAGAKTALHLATHGVIDARRPDASFLVMAPDDRGDGRLSYREIPGLAPYLPAARLVVLSACESSLAVEARTSRDDDGDGEPAISINGLAAQFRRAGVETLVGTLWKVDDQATLELMGHFYEELDRGADVARALQTAQQRMLADPARAHPYYWAAFVTVGDWR